MPIKSFKNSATKRGKFRGCLGSVQLRGQMSSRECAIHRPVSCVLHRMGK